MRYGLLAVPILALGLMIAGAPSVSAQECGHCEWGEIPISGEDGHQFQAGVDNYECSGGPGHAVHDCKDDENTWWTGFCGDDHNSCEFQEEEAEFFANLDQVTPEYASFLGSLYPDNVLLTGDGAALEILTCGGVSFGTVALTAPLNTPEDR